MLWSNEVLRSDVIMKKPQARTFGVKADEVVPHNFVNFWYLVFNLC